MKKIFEEVYKIVKQVPKGKVTTYGDIARILGNVRLSRVVGFALHANPYFGEVPCHRVVSKNGGLAPNFAFGGINIQKQMLENEGIKIANNCVVTLKNFLFDFDKN